MNNDVKFPLSCIYLTKKCPRRCEYCRIRDSKLQGEELTTEQWIEAFHILKDAGVEFNLILGNEPFMLKEELPKIIEGIQDINYGIYSSAPKELFDEYCDDVVNAGLKNFSIPIDLVNVDTEYKGDIKDKGWQGLQNLLTMKEKGVRELLGIITVHKMNCRNLVDIVKYVSQFGMTVGLNVIHWDRDGKYDFFPPKEELDGYILDEDDKLALMEQLKELLIMKNNKEVNIQNNANWFADIFRYLDNLDWHCTRDEILTIDADGSFRVCGYRKGQHVCRFNVFNFRENMDEFLEALHKDREECPGCFWSYPYLSEQWDDTANHFVDLDKIYKEQLNK